MKNFIFILLALIQCSCYGNNRKLTLEDIQQARQIIILDSKEILIVRESECEKILRFYDEKLNFVDERRIFGAWIDSVVSDSIFIRKSRINELKTNEIEEYGFINKINRFHVNYKNNYSLVEMYNPIGIIDSLYFDSERFEIEYFLRGIDTINFDNMLSFDKICSSEFIDKENINDNEYRFSNKCKMIYFEFYPELKEGIIFNSWLEKHNPIILNGVFYVKSKKILMNFYEDLFEALNKK